MSGPWFIAIPIVIFFAIFALLLTVVLRRRAYYRAHPELLPQYHNSGWYKDSSSTHYHALRNDHHGSHTHYHHSTAHMTATGAMGDSMGGGMGGGMRGSMGGGMGGGMGGSMGGTMGSSSGIIKGVNLQSSRSARRIRSKRMGATNHSAQSAVCTPARPISSLLSVGITGSSPSQV